MSNYRISSRGIIVKDNKILLNEFNHGKFYNTPGGGVEVDESLHQAVNREVLEETGYHIDVHHMMFIYEYNPIETDFKYNKRGSLSSFFYCTIDQSYERIEATVLDGGDGTTFKQTGCKWIPLNELYNIKLIPSIQEDIIAGLKNNDLHYIKEIK